MKNNTWFFSSESVSDGHPDKVADRISDAILDAYLQPDPHSKVACECLITTGKLVIAGEVSSNATVDPIQIAKRVLEDIGYSDESIGFDHQTAEYTNLLHQQSPEINASVTHGGAGDQGIMFGYATNETPELMPMAIWLSNLLMMAHRFHRDQKTFPWLLPDAKTQVTVRYENHQPVEVTSIVFSTQHLPGVSQETIRQELIEKLIKPTVNMYIQGSETDYFINPSGSFTIGGPHGDTGLTGRKIIVDTYGGSCPHGGGAFSGKDPSKVDRSAAYAARFVAKHIVRAGLAERCTVQLSYAIGKAEPISVFVDTHSTGKITDEVLVDRIRTVFDLTPNGIIEQLSLKQPIYERTANYGHFGRPGFPWERIYPHLINGLLDRPI